MRVLCCARVSLCLLLLRSWWLLLVGEKERGARIGSVAWHGRRVFNSVMKSQQRAGYHTPYTIPPCNALEATSASRLVCQSPFESSTSVTREDLHPAGRRRLN